MADDVKRSAADVPATPPAGATTAPTTHPSRAERARRSVYRGRFAVFYLLLAAVAGVAVGLTLVLVSRGGPAPTPAWSEWAPEGSAGRRATQIAYQVAAPYRLPSGKRIASAIASPVTATDPSGTYTITTIIVGENTSRGQAEPDESDQINATETVMYKLCGTRQNCAIGGGKPSPARDRLLQRESLELALYTLKYMDAAGSVLVMLPPPSDSTDAKAVFLERKDVEAELARPLSETLTAPLVPGIGEIAKDELGAINRITGSRLYTYQFRNGQDGAPILVLVPAAGA